MCVYVSEGNHLVFLIVTIPLLVTKGFWHPLVVLDHYLVFLAVLVSGILCIAVAVFGVSVCLSVCCVCVCVCTCMYVCISVVYRVVACEIIFP